MILLRPLYWLLLACLSWCSCATRKAHEPQNPLSREASERRYLSQHIIAIGEDGFAIDPYDLIHHDKKTPLQKRLSWDDFTTEITRFGLTEAELNPELDRTSDLFLFRDAVVPQLLRAADASKKPVTVYVHGGLNDVGKAAKRASEWLSKACPSIELETYPVFICWPSDARSVLRDHLFKYRNGVAFPHQRWYPWVTSPVTFLTDLTASIAKLPRTTADLLWESFKPPFENYYDDVFASKVRYLAIKWCEYVVDHQDDFTQSEAKTFIAWHCSLRKFEQDDFKIILQKINGVSDIKSDSYQTYWKHVVGKMAEDWIAASKENQFQPMHVSKGEFKTEFWVDTVPRGAAGLGFLPTKITIAGLGGGFGSEAWGLMHRRIDSMFQHDKSFQVDLKPMDSQVQQQGVYSVVNNDVRHGSSGVGAISVLLRQLVNYQSAHTNSVISKELRIIGHSMGTIVLNRALREFPGLKADTVVYMAAACSIKDFAGSVIPYMRGQGNQSRFYNLCLHPRAEERVRPLEGDDMTGAWIPGELAPRGSLLVWIDSFIDRPASFEDRVLGHFDNAMIASHVIPASVQTRVSMVAMAAGEPKSHRGYLQQHEGFNEYRFWDRRFWKLEGWQTQEREKLRIKMHSRSGVTR